MMAVEMAEMTPETLREWLIDNGAWLCDCPACNGPSPLLSVPNEHDRVCNLRVAFEHADVWQAALGENAALRKRAAVGDRMHDFLSWLFADPKLIPEPLADRCWGLMQDWVAPPPVSAGNATPNDPVE